MARGLDRSWRLIPVSSICSRILYFYFPLLVLKGIYHHWTYFCFFPLGLSKWKVWRLPSIGPRPVGRETARGQRVEEAFRLFDDDETGKISFKNLKRVAKAGPSLTQLQPVGFRLLFVGKGSNSFKLNQPPKRMSHFFPAIGALSHRVFFGEGSPTKIDVRKKGGCLILTFLLEGLAEKRPGWAVKT